MTMEYALRAATHLAEAGGRCCTVQQISSKTQVPQDYLSKVMRDLCRAGIVKSRPGRHGGYALGADPSRISLVEVIEAVEPIGIIEKCPLRNPCHAQELCPLHGALRSATESFIVRLRQCTLDTISSNRCLESPGDATPTRTPETAGGIVS